MSVELTVSVISVSVALIFSYLNYKRLISNDLKALQEKDQSDIVTLVKDSMSILNCQLVEIKDDVKEIKDEIHQSELSLKSHEEQLHTLFKRYDELKDEVVELGKEIRQIRTGHS